MAIMSGLSDLLTTKENGRTKVFDLDLSQIAFLDLSKAVIATLKLESFKKN